MLDEIRKRLIDSDISPQDLRIALAIIDEVEKELYDVYYPQSCGYVSGGKPGRL